MLKKKNLYSLLGLALVGLFIALPCFAESDADLTTIAGNLTSSFSSIGRLMIATAYLAGFSLVITAIFKFKTHRDNPTQVPMGTPVALLVIGICLIFLPGIISPAGSLLFGNNTSGVAGGFTGTGGNIPGSNNSTAPAPKGP